MRRTLLLTTGLVALSLSANPVLAQEGQRPKAGVDVQAPAAARQNGDEQAPATRSQKTDEGATQSAGPKQFQREQASPKAEAPRPSDEKASGRIGETTTKGAAERPVTASGNARRDEGETRAQRQAEPNAVRKGEQTGDADRNAKGAAKVEAEQPAKAERTPSGTRNGQAEADREQKGGAAPQRDQANSREGGTRERRAEGERVSVQVTGRLKIDETRASAVREQFTRHHDAEIRDRSVRLAVGIAIPAAVGLAVVPDEIVSQYPEFRDYDYVTEDDEVAIIDPRSREVVEVIGSEGGQRSVENPGEESRSRAEYRFSGEQNEMIRRSVSVGSYGGERPMLRVPSSVELKPLPRGLAEQLHAEADLGYFVDREDRIVVANPQTREVVDIVD